MTSKAQVTLPKELRKRLGIQNGSRIRFNIPVSGPVRVERVLYDLGDLWRMADVFHAGPKCPCFPPGRPSKGK